MKDFMISGAGFFDREPDPVVLERDGKIAYRNPAFAGLAREQGWAPENGAALPIELTGLEPGCAAPVPGWVCQVDTLEAGTLLRFRRQAEQPAITLDRLNQLAGRMRRPLGNLMGAMQLLRDFSDDFSPEKQEQYSAIGYRNCFVLQHMLDGMEFLALAEDPLRPVILDFSGLCADVARESDALLEMAGVTLKLEQRDHYLLVRGGEEMLRRMVYELLSNAARAAGNGGTVTLRVEKARDAARLTVLDTGDGFPMEELPTAFDPGAQTERPADFSGGLGLGLSICRTVVEKHGGRLALVSGKRGRVVAELPLCQDQEEAPLHTLRDPYGGLNEAKLMLAEVLPWQCFTREEE